MIVTDIKVWPLGVPLAEDTLATVIIVNNGEGDRQTGNYQYVVSHQEIYYDDGVPDPHDLYYSAFPPEGEVKFTKVKYWKKGEVAGFRRSLGAVKLLARVLKDARL